jgi:hypothetical protein
MTTPIEGFDILTKKYRHLEKKIQQINGELSGHEVFCVKTYCFSPNRCAARYKK